jgi:hypothetical protein
MNIRQAKQQEYFEICKNKYHMFNNAHIFFLQNKYYLENNRNFANQCLIACCQNNNWKNMNSIFNDLIILNKSNAQENILLIYNSHVVINALNYMFILCCENKYTKLFDKICQQLSHYFIPSSIVKYCFDNAIKNNYFQILQVMKKYIPDDIYVFPNFHYGYNYYFIEKKEESDFFQFGYNNSNIKKYYDTVYREKQINVIKRKESINKKLFLAWLISNNSPNKNCILYHLPNEISRNIIEQFI